MGPRCATVSPAICSSADRITFVRCLRKLMLAWPKPSDFDATSKTGVRRSGRIAVVSAVLPPSSHHAIAVSREADRAREGVARIL